METVTFGHFSNMSCMGVPFVMSLTTMRTKESNMAAVFVGLHLSAVGSESKQKIEFCNQRKNITGLKSSLRVIEWYAYCLGYLHFTSRNGFLKSSGTVTTLQHSMERVAPCNVT